MNKADIENYCPFNEVVRQLSNRWIVVLDPVFKRHVFISVNKERKSVINQVPNILNSVCWLGKPAVIHDVEIEGVIEFFKNNKKFYLM